MNIFAILNDMKEAVILCDALHTSSINNRMEQFEENVRRTGFYVEEIKLSMNGICIEKKNINGLKIIEKENKNQMSDPINIVDCRKVPDSDVPSTRPPNQSDGCIEVELSDADDDNEYTDNISVLEDQFDQAYGLKKNIDQKHDDAAYLKRCDEQRNRWDVERHKEKISVFKSGKSTYVKIKTKINKGTMRIIDISGLFADKYMIYDFMENKKMIDLTSNINNENEYKLFRQLELVIESYWWEVNKTNLIKKNKVVLDNYACDPSNNMDPEYGEMFDEFYVFMDENGGIPRLERDMHQHLNMNSDNHIFERDYSNE